MRVDRRSSRGCKALFTVLLVGAVLLGVHPGHGQLMMGASLNPLCINMQITISTCGIIPYPCATLSFWQPKWLVTTKATMRNQGGEHYHFNHVVVRPLTVGFEFNDPCAGCVVPTPAALVPAFYESLSDPLWRAGQAPIPMPPPVLAYRVGVWGGYYPRVGFVTHPSPVVASALAAVRGFDIAREPIDLWPAPGVVRPSVPLLPTAQTIVLPCMCANIPPLPLPCFRAGFDFGMLAAAPFTPGGIYEWTIWRRRTCVLPLPLSWCAQALAALPKGNLCL